MIGALLTLSSVGGCVEPTAEVGAGATTTPSFERLQRTVYTLAGTTRFVVDAEGNYRGEHNAFGEDKAWRGELSGSELESLHRAVSGLLQLADDEYSDPSIRDGVAVVYRVGRRGVPDREILCRNLFPPAVSDVDHVLRVAAAAPF